tara:strand:- start:1952 stop:4057 length:2106 start_codon:yes stop_codon:yes gene_type:complete
LRFLFSEPDHLFWFVFLLLIITLLTFYRKHYSAKQLVPLYLIRVFLFFILLLVYLNPIIIINESDNKNLKWNIYIDNSLSMSYHSNLSENSLSSGIDDIISKLEKKGIPIGIYHFGSKIDTNWNNEEKIFNDASTNLGSVIDHIDLSISKGLAGTLIITDGQANQGFDILIPKLNEIKPIHIVGVGDKDPLVDVAIIATNSPPVIIKGENVEIEVLVSSYGIQEKRVNVTINSKGKLLGSKLLNLSGQGSIDKIRFLINPEETGLIEYIVQVNALPDEVNIANNKQIMPIQVLKNEYKIAIITGAPNFNTSVLKNILNDNKKFEIDHYVLTKNGYSRSLKSFWDTRYDLILFDNNPVKQNAEEWESYLRVFAKKLLSQKTSFAIFIGNDVDKKSLSSYLNLMNLKIKKPLIELGSEYDWTFSKNMESHFPLQTDDILDLKKYDYPPLSINLEIDSANSVVLANFYVSDVNLPLMQIAEKPPLRYLVFSSPDLHQLFYKIQDNDFKALADQTFASLFSWIMRTGNGKDFYFRSGKDTYQQGEKVTIIGKPIKDIESSYDAYVHIYSNGNKINSKPIAYNSKTGLYTGHFWASKTGKIDYEIELIYGDRSIVVNKGNILVQESQIELNNVFLKEESLVKITEKTKGTFHKWNNRLLVLDKINNQLNKQKRFRKIILHESGWLFFIIVSILTIEWLYRRKNGMI